MHPRQWPTWAWASLAVAAAPLRLDLLVGDYSGATAVALFAGCLLPARRAASTQAWAVPALVLLSVLGLTGTPTDLGYVLARPLVAATAATLLDRTGHPRAAWAMRALVAALLLAAVTATWAWHEPATTLQLKPYYGAVGAMALAIAFYYALRLVAAPWRVVALIAALAPYYAVGVAWALLATRAGLVSGPTAAATAFHGIVTHLPGDALTAVVVAFFTGAKPQFGGWKSR